MRTRRFLPWFFLLALPACAPACEQCLGSCEPAPTGRQLTIELKTLAIAQSGDYAMAGVSYRERHPSNEEWSVIHVVELETGGVQSFVVSDVDVGGVAGTTFVAVGCGGLCLVPTSPPFDVSSTPFAGSLVAFASSGGSVAILGADDAGAFVEVRGPGSPTRVAVAPSPDGLTIGAGGFAFALGDQGNQVSVVKLDEAVEQFRVPFPCEPEGPVGVLRASKLLIGCQYEEGLLEFDPFTLSTARTVTEGEPSFIGADGNGYAVVSLSPGGTSIYVEGTGLLGVPVSDLGDQAIFVTSSSGAAVFVALQSGVARLSLVDGTSLPIPGLVQNEANPRIARIPGGGIAVLTGDQLVLLDDSGAAIGDPIPLPIPTP